MSLPAFHTRDSFFQGSSGVAVLVCMVFGVRALTKSLDLQRKSTLERQRTL